MRVSTRNKRNDEKSEKTKIETDKSYDPIISKHRKRSKISFWFAVLSLILAFFVNFFKYIFLLTLIVWLAYVITVKAYESKKREEFSAIELELIELEK